MKPRKQLFVEFFTLVYFCGIQWKSPAASRVDKNIIGAPKMRNIFSTPIKMFIFQYCAPHSYHSFNFGIAKVVTLTIFAYFFSLILYICLIASFLYCSQYSYSSFSLKGNSQKIKENFSYCP